MFYVFCFAIQKYLFFPFCATFIMFLHEIKCFFAQNMRSYHLETREQGYSTFQTYIIYSRVVKALKIASVCIDIVDFSG